MMTQEEFNDIALGISRNGLDLGVDKLIKSYAALLERNKELSQALLDIAHGSEGRWDDPGHMAGVIRYMIGVAEKALRWEIGGPVDQQDPFKEE